MDNKPVGVMDSGAGGFSSCLEIRKLLPKESITYYADLKYLPYGEKTQDFLVERTSKICSYLEKSGVKAIIIACNTASTAYLKHPAAFTHIKVPIFNVVTSTLQSLEQSVKSPSLITVLATGATVKSEIYKDSLSRLFPSTKIVQIAALEWASLVENVPLSSQEMLDGIRKYTSEVENTPENHVLLACTHYYFLAPLLRQELPHVNFHDSSAPVVKDLQRLLEEKDLLSGGPSSVQVFASKTTDSLQKMTNEVFQQTIPVVIKDL